MPRLIYSGDTTDTFGKFLPTPVIESIKISSVSSDEDIVRVLNAFTSRPSEGDEVGFNLNQLAKIKIRTSALFNSNDTFDSKELFEELFDQTKQSDSLYINFIIAKNEGVITKIKEDKTELRLARNYVNSSGPAGNTPYTSEVKSSSLRGYVRKLLNPRFQVYSIPLSDFVTLENFTSDFDDNGNAVLKSSYTDFNFHIKDFDTIRDITIFTTISTEDFTDLAASNLSLSSFAINFGDLSYEDIKINNKIAKFGDPVYVNANNLPYADTPLLALDGKYYKSDNVSHFFIKSSIKDIINKYYNERMTTSNQLLTHVNNIEYVISKYGDTIEFIPNLYKANNLSPSKSSATKLGKFYDDLRITINNINSSLLGQEQVVRRIYRNYKLVDSRVAPDIVFTKSFDDTLTEDSNFIYRNILHAAAARYVPVSDSMDFPGKAEIPITPEQAREGLDSEIDNLINELRNKLSDLAPEDLNSISFDSSGTDLSRERQDLRDFLARWDQRWTRNVGTTYDDQGRNNKKQEKKVKKKYAEELGYDYSKLSTKQFKEMKWWFLRDKMFELVKYKRTDGDRSYSGWDDRFKLDTKVLCSLKPKISAIRPSPDDNAPYWITIKPASDPEATSQLRNWNADVIFEKIIDDIKSESGSDDPIKDAVSEILSTLGSKLNSKMSQIRNSSTLMSQLISESSRDEVALELWNSFSAEATDIAYKTMSYKFDALIRCVFYPDPTSGVSQKPEYYYLPIAGGIDYGSKRFPYNKFQNLANKRSTSEWYYPITLGSRIADQILNGLYQLKSDFLNSIEKIIENIIIIEGSGIDDGTFNALSKLDIVVKKSGYFFFDLEKFIRKRSLMSRYMDMDTFINFFPAAKQMTNNCINVRKVKYLNSTYQTRIELATNINDDEPYEPSDFTDLIFETIQDGSLSMRPLVYKKAPVASGVIRYQDFFNSTGTEDNNFDADFFNSLSNITPEYTLLVKRNFGFPGFNDGDLPEGLTWKDDYRLACYNYQFFIDDDQYDRKTNTTDTGLVGPTSNNSTRDIATIEVHIKDNSLLCLETILNNFINVYDSFVENYYNKAIEFCSYNEYSQRFNNFFTDAILSEYPESGPWIDMVSNYILYLSIFTDFFATTPSYGEKIEFAEKILEQIRPETGTLGQLIEFNEKLLNFRDRLDVIRNEVSAFLTVGDTLSQVKFSIVTDIEVPVLDHIGDYTEISDRLSS